MLTNISHYFSLAVTNQSVFFFQPTAQPEPVPLFENFENDLAFLVVSAVKNQDDESLYKYGKALSKATRDDPHDAKGHYALAMYYTHPDINLSDERKFKKIVKHLKRAIELDPANKLYSQKLVQVETAYKFMQKNLRR